MSSSSRSRVGHGIAKALGIKLDYRNELGKEGITRGESVFSVSSADTYVEEEPTVWEWLASVIPSARAWAQYFRSLFPFVRWLPFYNLQWLAGDLVAGMSDVHKSLPLTLTVIRNHHRCRRCSSRDGLCPTR